ncbi:MAG TPA: DUF4943 family protein [Gemmataceae bacterium]|jgi:hypothetical protein|nr:DUF4943 family protein [Gemmataceae bacterium]
MRPAVAVVLCLAVAAPAPAAPAVKPKGPASEKVDKLFAGMRDGTYRGSGTRGFGFPDVGWEDVPALLARAEEEEPLRTFPTNPLSSAARHACREGVAALWLVEGIRQGGKFPSLNPAFAGSDDRAGATPEELKAAARAYRAWWERAKGKPEAAKALDPLADAPTRWR